MFRDAYLWYSNMVSSVFRWLERWKCIQAVKYMLLESSRYGMNFLGFLA
jgi:hypothetical protein